MKIAGIQFACLEDRENNIEKAAKIMELALNQGAKIVCFQEIFNLRWFPKERDEKAIPLAEDLKSATVKIFREKAKQADAVIVLPIFEKNRGRFFMSYLPI